MDKSVNFQDWNIATSIFSGFNDQEGILLCGYEWGGDPCAKGIDPDRLKNTPHIFSNKALAYGSEALSWRYDQNLIKWFELWGHPLSREGLGGDFEKTITQTNWCDTQAVHMKDVDIVQKLLGPVQIKNFIAHVEEFRPRLIFFLGIKQIECLQSPQVLPHFERITGKSQEMCRLMTKPHTGRKFKVGFQRFEHAQVVGLPHPSGSRGLQDSYISLFKDEIGGILSDFKQSRLG